MSTILSLRARRAVTVNKTGEQSVQTESFELWRVPSHLTTLILATDDIKAAYIALVKECSDTIVEDVFAPDDYWEETPIGTKVINTATEHINQLEDFLTRMDEGGYDIEWWYAK